MSMVMYAAEVAESISTDTGMDASCWQQTGPRGEVHIRYQLSWGSGGSENSSVEGKASGILQSSVTTQVNFL